MLSAGDGLRRVSCERYAEILCAGVLLITGGSLVLWRLAGRPPVEAGLDPSFAVTAFLIAMSILARLRSWDGRLARGLALAAVALAGAVLVQRLPGLSIRMPDGSELGGRGRFCGLSIALAVLLMDWRWVRAPILSQLLASICGTCAFALLISDILELQLLREIIALAPDLDLTPASSVISLLLSLSVFMAQPSAGFAAIAISDSATGMLTRRVLFILTIFPLAIALVIRVGFSHGLYGADLGRGAFIIVEWLALMIGLLLVSSRLFGHEKRARAIELRYRLLLESAPHAIVGVGRDGVIAVANEKASGVFGYENGKLIGRPIARLIADLGADDLSTRRIHADRLGVRRDGGELLVEVAVSPVDTDPCVSSILIVRDVTEQRHMERELSRMAAIVESSEDAIVAVDEERRIYAWNAGAERMFGYGAEEVSGTRIERFVPPIERRSFEARLESVFAGECVEHFEAERIRKDGSRVVVSVSLAPIRDSFGGIRGVSCTARDISKQAAIKAELECFAHAVSHDLKEPVRTVAGYLALLERRMSGDREAMRLLTAAREASLRQWRLIEDLLGFATAGHSIETRSAVDLNKVLEEALSSLEAAIAESGASITYGRLPIVSGSNTHLSLLFQNLLGNALKFRGNAPPRISIEADGADGKWLLSVRDNGIGMTPEQQNRIFVMFERAHPARFSGSGIGLATCKRVVEAHGGRIWVESSPERGSTFHFTLPAHAERVEQTSQAH